MKTFVLATALAAIPLTTAAAMPLSQFLPKAEALKRKGAMALFSSDLKIIKREMQTSTGQIRAERLAAVKAGRRPDFCPPAKTAIDADELLNHLRAIPAGQRGMPFKAAYKSFLVRKFPCPA